MRLLLQRVTEASVKVDGQVVGRIGAGLLILVGVQASDTEEDILWLARKSANLRIFNDANGVMNLSVKDINGEVLTVSQFTLYASTQKGNRPSYSDAAPPPVAEPLYVRFVRSLESELGRPVETGRFGADMKVSLVNDGPVTLWLDSRKRS
ncbi:MAG: D-tyrosyl-tRNA(Tyr) deacylase [Betaproteobacteria bacterium]|nr:D-tyrosyl-tRNA(Tyr) deacylase [Betaproteobacteria bacterium]